MQFNQQVFAVTGQDKATLLAAENAFRLSDRSFYNVMDFEQGWQNIPGNNSGDEIDYSSLVSVTRELDGNLLFVRYRGALNITNCCTFAFANEDDYGRFYHFLEEGLGLKRTDEKVSLFEAVGIYIVELIIVLLLTVYCYFQAVDLKNVTADPKQGSFLRFIQVMGESGVCLTGGIIAAFLIYQVNQLSENRPVQTVFLAKNL